MRTGCSPKMLKFLSRLVREDVSPNEEKLGLLDERARSRHAQMSFPGAPHAAVVDPRVDDSQWCAIDGGGFAGSLSTGSLYFSGNCPSARAVGCRPGR